MNYLLGIELNGSQLKIASLKKSGQSMELLKLDNMLLSGDEDEAVAQLTSWKEKNLPNAHLVKAVLTVSESLLYTKEIEMPKVNIKQMDEAVYWEIPSIAPISQAEAVYDWTILSESTDFYKVLVIVGKSLYFENIISIFAKAKIEISVIEPSSYAFCRAADLNIDKNSLLCIARENGIDYIVIKKGIPVFTTTSTENRQGQKNFQVRSEKDFSSELASGAKKIIDYWENKVNEKVQQVVLSGDLVYKFYNLDSTVKLLAVTPVIIGRLKKDRDVRLKNYKELDVVNYLVGLGAILRFLQKDVFDGINLFPASEKQRAENVQREVSLTMRILLLFGINLSIFILLIASIFVLNVWWMSFEKQSEKSQKLILEHPANSYIEEIESTNLLVGNSIVLTNSQKNLGERLRLIADLTPQTVKLTKVSLVNNIKEEWKIEGTGDRESILAYYEILSQRAKAADINMPYSNFNKINDNIFILSITW